MKPDKKGCLHTNDSSLKLFPYYSEGDCFLECTWNLAAQWCGCVPWYLMKAFQGARMCEMFGFQYVFSTTCNHHSLGSST